MPVQIIRKEQLRGTARHIQNSTYETYRFLLVLPPQNWLWHGKRDLRVSSEMGWHHKAIDFETITFPVPEPDRGGHDMLASDQADVTVTDIVLAPNIEAIYGYDQHIEIAYCIEGDATLMDLSTGQTHKISPGTLWVARPSEQFRFLARIPTRLICVFTPPFSGHETGFAGDQ